MNRIFVLLLIALFTCALPLGAQIKPSMKDPYIQREFEWSAFVHVSRVDNYLNYRGSTLSPITKVSVTYRDGTDKTKMYEEFFYHRGKVLGMHRRAPLLSADDSPGAIVLGGDLSTDCRACINTLMRVIVDFQLKHRITTVVMVPEDDYADVMSELSDYGFYKRDSIPSDGPQFSFLLRSNPYGQEDMVYLK
jgi:hypothetical protein